MQVEALMSQDTLQQQPKAAESIDAGRKELAKGASGMEKSSTSGKKCTAGRDSQPDKGTDRKWFV